MLQWFISFSELSEFSESSAPFRKNSITIWRTVASELVEFSLNDFHWIQWIETKFKSSMVE